MPSAPRTALRAVLERRRTAQNPTGPALLVAGGMFLAIGLVPSLKYPANPPTVGLEDTMGERSFGVLGDHGDLRRRRLRRGGRRAGPVARWGTWPAVGVAAGGYLAVMLCAMVPLPSFNEVPGTLTGSEGLLLDGFPAEVLANFRLYSLMNQALMWSFIGVTWVCLAALPRLSANQPVAAGTRQL